jgi:hypothetical protein
MYCKFMVAIFLHPLSLPFSLFNLSSLPQHPNFDELDGPAPPSITIYYPLVVSVKNGGVSLMVQRRWLPRCDKSVIFHAIHLFLMHFFAIV